MLLRNEKLTPKKTITPFNCDKGNDLQEYKFIVSLIKEHAYKRKEKLSRKEYQ